jgi:hypothetical protein
VPTSETIWPSPSQTLASAAGFGDEALEDMWMNDFERSNDLFAANRDFVDTFHPTDVVSLGSTAPFPPAVHSMPPMSSLPSMPLDPLLAGQHVAHYSDPGPRSTPASSHGTPLIYDDHSLSSSNGPRMAAALESFSRLNTAEQQQVLDIIYKRKGMAAGMDADRTWDVHGGYPMTPPAGTLQA